MPETLTKSSFECTHKLHKNSKTYLDVQNGLHRSEGICRKNRPWSELSENQPACKGHRDLSNCKGKMDWSIQNPR